ncbi:3-deoxy-7-phosphoheptulonate synthase [Saccharopolyspora sp. HNM0986]|uniref:3-deoxy-7-phosphoheptulonate synthase n=1 Tax=Saccharopolyspora galaxeae TaxID=2781241 RepID=UPI00190B0603|nr:3-deoxy-7-phosphoheptulonate synthase [Saccharopolyspora sp. HNM0986]MBK0870453.1 3-deoxy-7-phosphoheptulonate synthase [Saccharopolyspora sp. HNM0986]
MDQPRTVTAPEELRAELPADAATTARVGRWRGRIEDVLAGRDDRVLAVVGPCSVHDLTATRRYAARLRDLADGLSGELLVVLRSFFEKPRSTVGWTGLFTDPALDGGSDVERGMRSARRLLLDVAELGLPAATEWVSPFAPAYLADLVGYGTIGARTVESQPHRQLAAALPMPVGMKNGTTGSLRAAVDAVVAARHPHGFLGIGPRGSVAWTSATGNPGAHVVLRGGVSGPNYDAISVHRLLRRLRTAGLPEAVVIDASHGNSGKDHARQPGVVGDIGAQLASGNRAIRGVMVESFLVPGRQDVLPGRALTEGQSITDSCLGWDDTAELLRRLAAAVRARRRTGDLVDWLALA